MNLSQSYQCKKQLLHKPWTTISRLWFRWKRKDSCQAWVFELQTGFPISIQCCRMILSPTPLSLTGSGTSKLYPSDINSTWALGVIGKIWNDTLFFAPFRKFTVKIGMKWRRAVTYGWMPSRSSLPRPPGRLPVT